MSQIKQNAMAYLRAMIKKSPIDNQGVVNPNPKDYHHTDVLAHMGYVNIQQMTDGRLCTITVEGYLADEANIQ